jgi:endonuclease-8
VPEGDALHRAARRLQPLVGEHIEVETPNPRAQVGRIAERLDGRRLLSVEAVGKNLLLRFEGGYVLRSHLRMTGRWTLVPRGSRRRGRPWLVLRGSRYEGVQWNGPILELHARGISRLGPDILERPPRIDEMLVRLRREDQGRAVGDALLDQRLIAGVGNKWKAEALWVVALSPWRPLADIDDAELRGLLAAAARLMSGSLEGRRHANRVYRLVGRPCSRCGGRIRSGGQGDNNRAAYWCPGCQR